MPMMNSCIWQRQPLMLPFRVRGFPFVARFCRFDVTVFMHEFAAFVRDAIFEWNRSTTYRTSGWDVYRCGRRLLQASSKIEKLLMKLEKTKPTAARPARIAKGETAVKTAS
jgi:hypothetical protein